jgi:glycosyltransferase involved in cell wall biosynthesis
MHILHIPSWYPTKHEPFNGNFVKRHIDLIATKHQVTVLIFVSEDRSTIEITTNQISSKHQEITIYYPKKNNKILHFFSLRKAFKQVVKNVKDVDIIHGHVILEKGLLFLWAKNYFAKPLVISEHASYFFRENYQKLSVLQKFIILKCLKKSNNFSCVSKVLAEEINYLFPKLKIDVIPNVVNCNLFQIAENKSNEKLKFIHISTLEAVKNVPLILEAFEIFAKENVSFEFTIIAEKRNLDIENQIKKSPISNKINLIGPLEIEEVAAKLKHSDALVMFSKHETFSCVIAEAWASGTPVISSPVGVAKDMDSDLGILVQNMDSISLVQALHGFVKNKNQFIPTKLREKSFIYNEKEVLASFEQFYARFT